MNPPDNSLAVRRVVPEWLDELPATAPEAAASRADLRRLNRLMGHAGLLAKALRPAMASGRRIVELGGGDGTLLLRVARILAPLAHGLQVTLVDRHDLVSASTRAAFATLGWNLQTVPADVMDGLEQAREMDAIIANLFLHHFEDAALRRLLNLAAQRTRLFVACEPRRSRLALVAANGVGLIGCNPVTRHDAVLSVRAGFAAEELSRLWPATPEWRLSEGSAGWFSHQFVAAR